MNSKKTFFTLKEKLISFHMENVEDNGSCFYLKEHIVSVHLFFLDNEARITFYFENDAESIEYGYEDYINRAAAIKYAVDDYRKIMEWMDRGIHKMENNI